MPTAADLSIESVLEVVTQVFGLEGTERGDEYDILCPNPDHADRKPSCGVNLVTGLWYCFACGIGGDIVKLGQLVTGEPQSVILEKIKPRTRDALMAKVQRRIQEAKGSGFKLRRKDKLPGPYLDGPLTSLTSRGFTRQTLNRWGVRFVEEDTLVGKNGKFNIRSTIAIPIRDSESTLLGWCYRRTDSSPDWQPRYMYTLGLEISETWFGLQHHSDSKDIIICEGALDTMWLDQCGFAALGMLGSKARDKKILWLQRFQTVTIFPDRDLAGAKMVWNIGNILGNRTSVRVVRYSKRFSGKDPQELSPEAIRLQVEKAVNWTSWLIKNQQKEKGN